MEMSMIERNEIILKRCEIIHLKHLLNKYNKSTIGNEEELRSRTKELIRQEEKNEQFNHYLAIFYHAVLRYDYTVRPVEPPRQIEPRHNSTSENVAQRLRLLQQTKSELPKEYTVNLIQKYFEGDDTCQEDGPRSSTRFSLICPLGKVRMNIPARGKHCEHLQCFDAEIFLTVAENMKKNLACPVCAKVTTPDSIMIDTYFKRVLETSPVEGGDLIEIYPDFGWTFVNDQAAGAGEHPEALKDDIVFVQEVERPQEPKRRKIERAPVIETPIRPEDMLQIVEIND